MNAVTRNSIYMLYPQSLCHGRDYTNDLLFIESVTFNGLLTCYEIATVDPHAAPCLLCGKECAFGWQTSSAEGTISKFQWAPEEKSDSFALSVYMFHRQTACDNYGCFYFRLEDDMVWKQPLESGAPVCEQSRLFYGIWYTNAYASQLTTSCEGKHNNLVPLLRQPLCYCYNF